MGGDGSDHAVFVQHLGISATNMGFGQGPGVGYPVYHSVTDNWAWMAKFGDPGFHRSVRRYVATLSLGLSAGVVAEPV